MQAKTLLQSAKAFAGVAAIGLALNGCAALVPGACTDGAYMDAGMNGDGVQQATGAAQDAQQAAQQAEEAAQRAQEAAQQAEEAANKAENILDQQIQK